MNLMSNEFTQQVSDIVVYGKEEANRLQNDHIEPEHLLLGILRDGECKAAEILKSFYLDLKGIKNELDTQLREKSILENYSQDISFSEEASKILTLSKLEARLMNDEKVDTPHILLAIMRDNQNNAYKILEKNDVTYEKIIDRLKQEEAPFDGLDFNDDEEEEGIGRRGNADKNNDGFGSSANRQTTQTEQKQADGGTPYLDNYGIDLTKAAEGGKLDPVVGREKEIERIAQILSRRKKNNPILIGEPGVGKSAIAEGLALRIVEKRVSRALFGKRIISLDMTAVVAGTKYRGQFEERIRAILTEVKKHPDVILFIDEINCVSETLAPTMLQFLQCKTFGNQAVPAGWVIVAAGNPPEYNKSVRDFDIVTLDRVRRMDIEPDLPVWKDYARAAHIHSAILSYLELHPQSFYQINADVDGTQFVTARGWEDLSNLLDTYEALGLQADEELIREYIQHPKIAEDFSAYLDLYYKYRDDYGVEEILAGQTKPAVFARLLQAPFDERLSLVSLLLAGLDTRFTASLQADAVADACYAFLRETKKALATLPEDIPDGSAELFSQQIKDYEAETQQKRDAGLLGKAELTNRLQVQAALHQWEGELRRANAAGTQEAFDLLRGQFGALADQREATQKTAAAALEAAFDFMEQAFAESQEMVVFVTELTVNPASHQFLTENGCERYFKYNKDLLLDHRKAALQQELAAEQRRHGGV